MSNQKNNLGMFSQRVEEAINSRFILADRHISGLLKCVATIPELTAVVGETLKNVSYADEYDKARVVLTKNGKSVCKFVMPNDKKRIIAFTVCLLTEFDSGRRSLLEFLTEFFYDEDTNVAYTKFCDTVLKPFKRAGEMVLKNLGSSAASNEDYDEESALKIAPPAFRLDSAAKTAILNEIAEFEAKIKLDTFMSKPFIIECCVMAEAFAVAVKNDSETGIKIMWIGFKNTIHYAQASETNAIKIKRILLNYNLIDG